MNASAFCRFVFVAASLCLANSAHAQGAAAAGGAITGRVFNPVNGEYLRNAEVRIQGTPLVAISEDGGYYRINNVPPGQVTVVASYLGHVSSTAPTNVSATAP